MGALKRAKNNGQITVLHVCAVFIAAVAAAQQQHQQQQQQQQLAPIALMSPSGQKPTRTPKRVAARQILCKQNKAAGTQLYLLTGKCTTALSFTRAQRSKRSGESATRNTTQ